MTLSEKHTSLCSSLRLSSSFKKSILTYTFVSSVLFLFSYGSQAVEIKKNLDESLTPLPESKISLLSGGDKKEAKPKDSLNTSPPSTLEVASALGALPSKQPDLSHSVTVTKVPANSSSKVVEKGTAHDVVYDPSFKEHHTETNTKVY
ncbi:MAG: hypothetical protein B7Y25_08345 [Alphaproteobacteria bacterium 16-39-46]|nr:MAG: hypothetical protein B7Y25_08345 [Alphaproteobacteria bacterium 16-39-46]OZA41130.1 MAG: hypothetical protein B7X84_08520 [Alphaproteobacteria bacterium 17-39-52]HQS84881.1 hypothetical protein [Alphaproteobacteria bacterium]HQS94657.1 hypothetical protein [Alphaproteobacteria bacterium]